MTFFTASRPALDLCWVGGSKQGQRPQPHTAALSVAYFFMTEFISDSPLTPRTSALYPLETLRLGNSRVETSGAAAAGINYEVHRAVFAYGPLMAPEVLDALLDLGSGTARSGARRSKPAKMAGYKSYCMRLRPYPGALEEPGAPELEGHLLEHLQPLELKLIDLFMDARLERKVVTVTATNGFGGQERVEAIVCVVPTDKQMEVLHSAGGEFQPWVYSEFRRAGGHTLMAEKAAELRRSVD